MTGHLPTFSPPDLPEGYAECLRCGDWITALDLFSGACQGPSADDRREAERERTVAMVERCARHQ